jgi:hypothetical protein
VRINNEFSFDISVVIEDNEKYIPAWGNCSQLVTENIYEVIACHAEWEITWDKSPNNAFPEDEEEFVCKEKTVDVKLMGVDGLDRSVTVNEHDNLILTVSVSGWQ